jgi:hypothetical protein
MSHHLHTRCPILWNAMHPGKHHNTSVRSIYHCVIIINLDSLSYIILFAVPYLNQF